MGIGTQTTYRREAHDYFSSIFWRLGNHFRRFIYTPSDAYCLFLLRRHEMLGYEDGK